MSWIIWIVDGKERYAQHKDEREIDAYLYMERLRDFYPDVTFELEEINYPAPYTITPHNYLGEIPEKGD